MPRSSFVSLRCVVALAGLLFAVHAMAGDWKNFSKPPKEELKKKLAPEVFQVTQESGTEKPFKNKYHDNHADGIYVDAVSGEPLFSSKDKYDSGTGWPSFFRTIDDANITLKEDRHLAFFVRTEVRSKRGDSHLGHVFDDGTKPTGKRFCMNSAAMEFIPKDQLEARGYGEFKKLFDGRETAASEERVVFAGGCFWCMESDFKHTAGVTSVRSGFAGGKTKNPTYEQVSTGTTGHREVVEVAYDPKKVTYDKLLEIFWDNVDPSDANGQFCDKGEQYTAAIYVKDAAQRKAAEASLKNAEARLKSIGFYKGPIATKIVAAAEFYPADEHHQGYSEKNSAAYQRYRKGCGRDATLEKVWGKKK